MMEMIKSLKICYFLSVFLLLLITPVAPNPIDSLDDYEEHPTSSSLETFCNMVLMMLMSVSIAILLAFFVSFIYTLMLEAKRRWFSRSGAPSSQVVVAMSEIDTRTSTAPPPLASVTASPGCNADNDREERRVEHLYPTLEWPAEETEEINKNATVSMLVDLI